MERTIQLKTNQLTAPLIEGLRKYFDSIKTNEVTISFSIPDKARLREETQEETNKRIENASLNLKNGKNITFTVEEFNALSNAIPNMK